LLFMSLVSMACTHFWNHDLPPLNVSRFDRRTRFVPPTFIGRGTRTVVLMEDPVTTVPLGGLPEPEPSCPMPCAHVPLGALAMPCKPVTPRRKPKFIDVTPSDIETFPVAVFKRYGYAIDLVKDELPKVVNRVDGGENIADLFSYAIARYRAIELANGDGLLSGRGPVNALIDRWSAPKVKNYINLHDSYV